MTPRRITFLERWWRCHRHLRRVARQLELAGVARSDPLYPLILEMALVPARMGRVLGAFLAVMALGASIVTWIVRIQAPFKLTTAPEGPLLIIDTPHGFRNLPCPLPGRQLCLQILQVAPKQVAIPSPKL
jgi:hypothetical protein